MPGENEGQEKEANTNPLIDAVFKPPLAAVYVHSCSRRVLSYIVLGIERNLGKENVQVLPPYFNEKRQSWGIQVIVKKFPRILTDSKYVAIREALATRRTANGFGDVTYVSNSS
ncbi:MAG: hypothetical protein QXQ94_10205 [Candidatus Bathyarchaeia archaeon]